MSSDATFQSQCLYCGCKSPFPVCSDCSVALGHGASMVPLPESKSDSAIVANLKACPECSSACDINSSVCVRCGYLFCLTRGCQYQALPQIGYCPTCSGKRDRVQSENPKDLIGTNKIPLHLWPETATVLGSLALFDGALKYGRSNWRAVGIRASVYYDAAKRHLNAWFEGEDLDKDSGLPHLAHALACIAILVDADQSRKLTDDRQYPADYLGLVESMTPHVQRLRDLHKGKTPRQHYTIQEKDKP